MILRRHKEKPVIQEVIQPKKAEDKPKKAKPFGK